MCENPCIKNSIQQCLVFDNYSNFRKVFEVSTPAKHKSNSSNANVRQSKQKHIRTTKDFIVNRIENGKYHVINLLFISLFTPNNEILGLLCSKWRPPNFRCKQHLLNIVHTLGNRLITSSCKHLAQ